MDDVTTGPPGNRLGTLVRTRSGYRVYDPALVAGTHYTIDDHGDLVYTRLPAGSVLGTVVLAALVSAVWIGDDSWLWTGVTFLIALSVATALAVGLLAAIHASTNPARRYRNRTGRGAFAVEVSELNSADGQLCRRAERLAASPSWVDGRVDPGRRLGSLLWCAVGEGDADAVAELAALTEPATDPGLQGQRA